jgi:osmotically-inducible protein OsmY
MADNHRTRGNRTSNYDWNENNGRQDRDRSRDRDYEDSNSRFRRYYNEGYNNDNDQNEFDTNRYERENSGRFGNQDRNYGYGGREYGSSYGGGVYQGNSSYYGSGYSGNGGSSYGQNRNLYDRDYEGYNRNRSSRSTDLGGSNYAGYDRNRDYYNEDGNYGNRGRYGNNENSNYGRMGYGDGNPNERSWWDRTRDEVSSWFGDDDAERRRERDRTQGHRGKGPKNYTRSDERIKEDINDRLSDDPFVDASEIEVTVNSGEVTLTGTVDERSDKRRAEDIAEAVSGVKNVENRIRVSQHTANAGTDSNIGTGTSVGTSSGSAYNTGVTGSGSTSSSRSSKGNLVNN